MKKAIASFFAISCVLGLFGCNNTQPSYKEPEFFYYWNRLHIATNTWNK